MVERMTRPTPFRRGRWRGRYEWPNGKKVRTSGSASTQERSEREERWKGGKESGGKEGRGREVDSSVEGEENNEDRIGPEWA